MKGFKYDGTQARCVVECTEKFMSPNSAYDKCECQKGYNYKPGTTTPFKPYCEK